MIAIARWRDAALVLLSLEAFLAGLLPAAALYFGLRGVREFQEWLTPQLLQVRLYVWRIRGLTLRVATAIAGPFVWLHSFTAGWHRGLDILAGR